MEWWEEWELYRERWHQHNVETNLSQWLKAKELGLDSSICSVEGCLRDAIGFMWADEEDIQALIKKPGLVENWDGEMERWKRERDGILKNIRDQLIEINGDIATDRGIFGLKWYISAQNKGEDTIKLLNKLNEIENIKIRNYNWNDKRNKKFWQCIRTYKNKQFSPKF